MELKTQPNEHRCAETTVAHEIPLPQCCPISGNPQPGSFARIYYAPEKFMLEVTALKAYIDSYQGGRGEIRSMEGMIQAICQDCANCVEVDVSVIAELVIEPGQKMFVECEAKRSPSEKAEPEGPKED